MNEFVGRSMNKPKSPRKADRKLKKTVSEGRLPNGLSEQLKYAFRIHHKQALDYNELVASLKLLGVYFDTTTHSALQWELHNTYQGVLKLHSFVELAQKYTQTNSIHSTVKESFMALCGDKQYLDFEQLKAVRNALPTQKRFSDAQLQEMVDLCGNGLSISCDNLKEVFALNNTL